MKTSKLALTGLLSAASIFTACGDDVIKVTNETSGMEIVASADSLEKCTSKNADKTVFVSGENAAYICADSAWKNVSETEKTSCSAEMLADSTGFKIVCDGDSVGVVKNGANGEKGDKGESSTCTAESLSDGSGFKIVCDGDSVGVVKNGANGTDGKDGENCRLSDNGDGTVEVVCGETSTTLYKAFCGGKLFNPDSSFCVADSSIVPLCGGKPYDFADSTCHEDVVVPIVCEGRHYSLDTEFCFADSIISRCGGKTYDLNASFCFADSVVPLCDGKSYDLDSSFCFADSVVPLCGGKSYDLDSSFCFADSIVPLCGGKSYDLDSSFCLDEKVYKNKTLVWNLMNPEIEYGVFVDKRDDQVYRSVKIGEQTWMAENLNYAMVGSYCPINKQDSCAKYGRLYTWSVAMDSAGVFGDAGRGCGYGVKCEISDTVRGACPRGWHLPSVAERNALVNAVGGSEVAGRALKSGYVWKNNGYGTDSFGFSALPVSYNLIGYSNATFWVAAESNDKGLASGLFLRYDSEAATLGNAGKNAEASIRCVKD